MEHVNALVLLIGLVALLLFLYGPWQNICIDWARNRIFEARDSIFDLAAQGRIDFDSSEYQEIRDSLNCLIRFAHRISWPSLIWIRLTMAGGPETPSIFQALSRIEDERVRRKIHVHVNKASKATLLLLFVRSPLLWFFLGIGLLVRIATRSLDWVAHLIAQEIQSEAEQYEEGEQGRFAIRTRTAH